MSKLFCNNCSKPLQFNNSIICKCKMTVYCCENCRINHWDSHFPQCLAFSQLFSFSPPVDARDDLLDEKPSSPNSPSLRHRNSVDSSLVSSDDFCDFSFKTKNKKIGNFNDKNRLNFENFDKNGKNYQKNRHYFENYHQNRKNYQKNSQKYYPSSSDESYDFIESSSSSNFQFKNYPTNNYDDDFFNIDDQKFNDEKFDDQKFNDEKINNQKINNEKLDEKDIYTEAFDFEYNSNRDSHNRLVLDFSEMNKYAYGEGIKKMLLRFKYDEKTLEGFNSVRDSWEIMNLAIMPPDGTFMLLERSSFKVDNFMSVTFYINYNDARKRLNEIRLKTNIAKKNDPLLYKSLWKEQQKIQKNRDLLEKRYTESIEQFLKNGVGVINSYRSETNGLYRFAGHSNSQLRNTSCYLIKASCAEIYQTLYSIGDFDEIADLGKLVKYIGLLFTTVKSPIILTPKDWTIEDDILSPDGKYCFTDGCGRVSTAMMREIMSEMQLPLHGRTISAVQIRFKGFKGMIVHDPKATKIHFTKSMLKFNDNSVNSLIGFCNWSRPFMPGYLILHYVLLLSTLGIKDEVFEKKQNIYNNQLKNLMADPFVAYQFIKDRDPILAAKFRQNGFTENFIRALRSLKREELTKFTKNAKTGMKHRQREKIERVRVFVPKSRNVHGVRDTAGLLKYGQIYFCPTMPDGSTRPLVGKILMGRTPCYAVGDMRVLQAVDPGEQYHHLFDVVVFPTDKNAPRPHPDQMSGGDLDGDLFWCCWDPVLIPEKTAPAFDYSGVKGYGPRSDYKEETNERIKFFANNDARMLGIVDSVYFQYADRLKADCEECRELNDIFTKLVDNDPSAAKEKINQLRIKLTSMFEKPQNFIWRRIEAKNKKLRKKMSPNFGIVRRGLKNFNENFGGHHIIEIYATDFDEPIFVKNDMNFANTLKEGTIVRFESSWDSHTNRYWAYNIRPDNTMNSSHLIKNLNIGICEGIIKQINYNNINNYDSEKPLGEIIYYAEFMLKIIDDLSIDEVPTCYVQFTEEGLNSNKKITPNDLFEGQRVKFNLGYNYKGIPLAMDVDLMDNEEKQNYDLRDLIRLSKDKKEKKINSNFTPGDIPDQIKNNILKLLKSTDLLAENDFIEEYCSEFFSKLNYSDFGFKSLKEIMNFLPEVNTTFDAANNAYFALSPKFRENCEKNKNAKNFDKNENYFEIDDFEYKEISDNNITSDFEANEIIGCYYCNKPGHNPIKCTQKNDKKQSFLFGYESDISEEENSAKKIEYSTKIQNLKNMKKLEKLKKLKNPLQLSKNFAIRKEEYSEYSGSSSFSD